MKNHDILISPEGRQPLKFYQLSLGFLVILASFAFCVPDVFSENPAEPPNVETKTNLSGTLIDSNTGKPISNVLVSVESTIDSKSTSQKTISDKNGKFEMAFLGPGQATVTYQAEGYLSIQEKGLPLRESFDLSKTLQKGESVGGWWVLLILVPGILGLVVAFGKETWESWGTSQVNRATAIPPSQSSLSQPRDYQFLVAMLGGLIWGGTLAALIWVGDLYRQGIFTIRFFTSSLTFELYIPVFGFLGALLYVLDLSRRGKEDIPKGKEFGMRLIMGPYVAIIMVILFGHELEIANLTSPVARGTIAFFSGLLVVTALQGLIERAQERLGKWRNENLDEPSKISDRLGLNREEELMIRRNQFEKDQLKLAIGEPVWKQLQETKITTVEEFSHLTDQSLEEIAANAAPPGETEDLKILRKKAKKFGNLQ